MFDRDETPYLNLNIDYRQLNTGWIEATQALRNLCSGWYAAEDTDGDVWLRPPHTPQVRYELGAAEKDLINVWYRDGKIRKMKKLFETLSEIDENGNLHIHYEPMDEPEEFCPSIADWKSLLDGKDI